MAITNPQRKNRTAGRLGLAAVSLCAFAGLATALDRFEFATPGADKQLRSALLAASLVAQTEQQRGPDAQALFAAARADYGRLIGELYADGYYSAVVSILIDGKEAADIAPLDAPAAIGEIKVSVRSGPQFTFARARMKPYAKGTKLPPAYGDTKPARSTAIVDAARAGVEGWRNIGHSKADVAGQSIVADHVTAKIDAEILLDPGPRAVFGTLRVSGYDRMDPARLARIAGFPTGEVFDPKALDKVGKRLRRSGVFRSVALHETEALGPGNTQNVDLVVVEEALRRFGVSAEVSSSAGLNLSGYWLHRNLFGGAERLRFDAAIDNIGGQGSSLGYDLGARIDRPATPVTDATAFLEGRASRTELPDLTVDSLSLGFGLSRLLSDRLTVGAGITYLSETARDAVGNRDFQVLALPVSLEWDSRDDTLNTSKGYYLDAGLTPFLGFATTGSGAQIKADVRAYRALGDKLVLAGRLQFGTVIGAALAETPPNYLFYSGGGGTVRGQPFQSLGVPITRSASVTVLSGGTSFVGLSGEARAHIKGNFGAVAFYDAGFVSDGAFLSGSGEWHAGAGLGLRYQTGIGPIRVDLGLPVSGGTSDGAQLYVGIGQAF